jgi:hypothetical protein
VHTFFVNEFGNLVSTTNTVVEPMIIEPALEEEKMIADFGVNFL